jgi:hypothetical protein
MGEGIMGFDMCECWLVDIAYSTAAADGACSPLAQFLSRFFASVKTLSSTRQLAKACSKGKRQAPRSKVFKLQRVQLLRGLLGFVMASDITFLPIAV